MTTNPTSGNGPGVAERMGLKPDQAVMEMGWDEDVDDALRATIEQFIGGELLDEDSDEVVDVVILWYRDDDGDLVDTLVDSIGPLADEGIVWLLTPKRGRDGFVDPAEISEAASVAGLSSTSIITVSAEWAGARLVGRKSGGTGKSGGRR